MATILNSMKIISLQLRFLRAYKDNDSRHLSFPNFELEFNLKRNNNVFISNLEFSMSTLNFFLYECL